MLELMAKIENCPFECEAGDLRLCEDWIDLKAEITRLTAECQKWQEWHDCEYRERKKYRWDDPEWEDVKVNADPQSPNYVWYKDECGVTRQVPRDAEIIAVFRRRKPEVEPEVWEGEVVPGVSTDGSPRPGLAVLPHSWLFKRVRVEVIDE